LTESGTEAGGTTDDRGEAILRVVPMLSDINANGHIFGGWILSHMDIAGGIMAGRVARGPVATVAIESMTFIAPILLRDIVSIGHRSRFVSMSSRLAAPTDSKSISPTASSPSSRSTRTPSRGRCRQPELSRYGRFATS
jgi:hypothetical protein